MTLLTPQFLL